MRKLISFFCLCSLSLILAGCSQSSGHGSDNPTPDAVPVSLSMTDDPPSGVTVLLFQISLTAARLTPASGSGTVSLLSSNAPVQINVTQLQTVSAFLDTAKIPVGTYNNLTLTFGSPQLVIFNESNQNIASQCPLKTICNLTPQLDNSPSVTLSSSPFPLTVTQNTSFGFLVDFHLNNVIQNDLSVNLGVANGVTVSQVSTTLSPPPSGPSPFGYLSGTVESVNASQNQFTLQNAFGGTVTVDVNSSTKYLSFPSNACSTSSFSCIAVSQSVQVEVASIESDGSIIAADVSDLQATGQQPLVGDVLGVSSTNGNIIVQLLLHSSPNGGSQPTTAYVTVPASTAFSVDAGSFALPAGFSFAGPSDLVLGQEVTVDVVTGTLSSPTSGTSGLSSVSFTTDRMTLEAGQFTSKITAISPSNSSFTIAGPSYCVPGSCSAPSQVLVETTSQTTYQGFTPDDIFGLTVNGAVSVQGWLFSTPTGTTSSTMVAQTVIARSGI